MLVSNSDSLEYTISQSWTNKVRLHAVLIINTLRRVTVLHLCDFEGGEISRAAIRSTYPPSACTLVHVRYLELNASMCE